MKGDYYTFSCDYTITLGSFLFDQIKTLNSIAKTLPKYIKQWIREAHNKTAQDPKFYEGRLDLYVQDF